MRRNEFICLHNKNGGVLIFLLFITMALSYIVLEYSYNNRLNLFLNSHYYKEYSDEEGYKNAALLTAYMINNQDNYSGYFAVSLKEYLKLERRVELDGKMYYIQVIEDKKKINLNKEGETKITGVIMEHFKDRLSEEQISQLADGILDWRDKDDFVRLSGAENNYYKEKGYKAANGNFRDLFELKLVKNVNEEVFVSYNEGLNVDSWSKYEDNTTIPDNVSRYNGLFDLFTIYEDPHKFFDPVKGSFVDLKKILRIYVRTDKSNARVYFLGLNENKYKIFYWRRIF